MLLAYSIYTTRQWGAVLPAPLLLWPAFPYRSLPRCHAFAAIPAFPSANHAAASVWPGVDDAEVFAAAASALQAAVVISRLFRSVGGDPFIICSVAGRKASSGAVSARSVRRSQGKIVPKIEPATVRAYEAVQPVVIHRLRSQFPFVDRTAAAFGLHPVFGRQMFGEEAVQIGFVAKEGEATPIAHGHGQPGMAERLPIVGVEHDVAN